MKEIEILEGNKLIAEFMGGVLKPPRKEHPNNPYNKPTWWGVGLRKDAGNFDLYYHSSWDWLIPVVEKIEKECFHEVVIFGTYCNINQGDTHDMGYIGGNTKIEAVYKAVIEFIKWYNQNKPHD